MAKDLDLADFQLSSNPLEAALEPFNEVSNEAARSSLEIREPKSAKELAAQYRVSDRAFQDWFKTVCSSYVWVSLSDLKTGNSNKTRYTVLCQDLIAQYRDASKSLSADDWIKTIYESNRDKVQILEGVDAELVEDSQPLFVENSVMVPYQPQAGEMDKFTPPERKIRKFVSTNDFVNTAKENTETALDITQSNSVSLTDALINQMQQEGQKLGLTLFQAKYGTAQSVVAGLEETLAKKSGLETIPAAPQDS